MDKASAQTRVTVQPEGTCQTQCTRKQIIKIVLVLLVAGALVTLVVAFVAPDRSQSHDSVLMENSSVEENLYELQTMLAKPIKTKIPQPPLIGAKPSKSLVTPTTTATTSTTTPAIAITSSVEEKLYELQTMLAKPMETKMPQPSSIGAKPSKSPVTFTTTTTSATTKTSPDTRHRSCADIFSSNPSATSGVYTIYTEGRVPGRKVWCDMVTHGGGWTRFQFRHNGSLEFNKTWTEYRRGFGSADDECWLGNDDLHRLTAAQPSELRVDLMDWDGKHGYAQYFTFSVGNASTNYILHVGGHRGSLVDSLALGHNARPFSTKDRDNDDFSWSCATSRGGSGGWWYGGCDMANLNGRYFSGGVRNEQGLEWVFWSGHYKDYSYKAAAMMVRPRN